METLTKHFREITRAAFARHGFAQGDVVGHWPDIVGADLAQHCVPDRIRWPRQAGDQAQKSGGTLFIRAAPGRTLDIQYEASRITARINSFLGYGAIAAIKVTTSPTAFAKAPPNVPDSASIPYEYQPLETIDEATLKGALSRLGRGVAASRRSSPQGK